MSARGRTHRICGSLRSLTSGYAGTGCSSIATLEEVSLRTGERQALACCLLNVGDSTQRFCIQHRLKLSRVKCIILSSLAAQHTSGLIGVLLALSDLGCASVSIVGPVGLSGFVHNLRPFVNKK